MRKDKILEDEASLFAMLLLMPKQHIENDLANGLDLGSDEDMKRLAKKYGVPLTALAYRIAYYHKHKN